MGIVLYWNDKYCKMSRIKLSIFLLVLMFIGFTHCKVEPVYNFQKDISVKNAAVVTAHPVASEIGLAVLREGGNAVDAAIAVQFALAVCYPVAGNIGGGGFMVYRDSLGEVSCLDFREMAPSSAHADMYLDENGEAISEMSRRGHLAAGVPGTVDGMWEAFKKYSKLKDWKRLINPSIKIARDGYKITSRQARMFNEEKENFNKYNDHTPALVKESPWKKGELLMQPQLASTLEHIANKGVDGFYQGIVADHIVNSMKANGGIITHEDLSSYTSIWRKPIQFNYEGYTIYSMPPPSSGGVALCQLFEMIEPFDLPSMGFHSSESVHLIAEAERRVYADRSKHLGDADYYPVPLAQLLDSTYIASRFNDFNPQKANRSKDIEAGIIESEETTHYSIVDQWGNAVSITTTINGGYGSKSFVNGAGFLLNNEMDDFSAKPGTPNLYGLVGAEANKIEPGKRMLSSMTPTIVTKNENLKMIVGTPGGSTIITSVFQVILNKIEYQLSLKEAVHNPRFHHQWLPDYIRLEKNALDVSTRDTLTKLGHELQVKGNIGKVEAIWIEEDGTIKAVADWRADDHASGY